MGAALLEPEHRPCRLADTRIRARPGRPGADHAAADRPPPDPRALRVANDRNTFIGTPVAHQSRGPNQFGLTLWKLDGPPQLLAVEHGFRPNGDIWAEASVTAYDCAGGDLQLTLLPKATDKLEIDLDGRPVVQTRIAGLASYHTRIPVPTGHPPRPCTFRIVGGPAPRLDPRALRAPPHVGLLEADEHLPDVVAAEEPGERAGDVLDPLEDRLPVDEAAVRDPRRDLGEELAVAIVVVEDEEALEPQPLRDEEPEVAGARLRPARRCSVRSARSRSRARTDAAR